MTELTLRPEDEASVDPNLPPDPQRRFWVATACAAGGAATVGAAVPFVGSFGPSEKARAAGAPVDVDISALKEGELRTVEWRGKPIWVMRRSSAQIEDLQSLDSKLADPDSDRPGYTPDWAKNRYRSRDPEVFVAVGICTHLGCSPTPELDAGPGPGLPSDWKGGYFCPCHGSYFDLAGRVYKNVPAPDNLEVPPYIISDDGTTVTVGVDEDGTA